MCCLCEKSNMNHPNYNSVQKQYIKNFISYSQDLATILVNLKSVKSRYHYLLFICPLPLSITTNSNVYYLLIKHQRFLLWKTMQFMQRKKPGQYQAFYFEQFRLCFSYPLKAKPHPGPHLQIKLC